jgi:hypothetical protein
MRGRRLRCVDLAWLTRFILAKADARAAAIVHRGEP